MGLLKFSVKQGETLNLKEYKMRILLFLNQNYNGVGKIEDLFHFLLCAGCISGPCSLDLFDNISESLVL
jgi:hypothetical protein